MTPSDIVKRLAEFATRPVSSGTHQPIDAPAPAAAPAAAPATHSSDLFIWFEDTSSRSTKGRLGIAGLPEALLPWSATMRVIERRYAEGHLHLLSAVRLRCKERTGERIAAIYTAALSVGTVAWIGTGTQYELAWREMFPSTDPANDPAPPDFPSEI
ncbi:MAG TPA: hypothetical protein VFR86_00090 [Burkholderiaceae bacterium]|nr:hypothetical protein [Burkholderiaceae bacterium]